jgi:hypothetical protein
MGEGVCDCGALIPVGVDDGGGAYMTLGFCCGAGMMALPSIGLYMSALFWQ